MALNPHLDAASIEQDRCLRGIPNAKLAREISVTPRTYSRYLMEGFPAEIAPTLSTILDVPAVFLDSSHPHELKFSNINFRAGRKAQAAHRQAAVANGNLLSEVDSWIRKTFTLPHLDWIDLSNESPKLAAQLLRQAWGLGTNPAPNMVHLCESRGISVYGLTNIAKSVDAFSAWVDSQPFIFVSRQQTPERIRFDIAHELGHLVLHHNSTGGDNAHQEKEADASASEFLIPQGCAQGLSSQASQSHRNLRIQRSVQGFRAGHRGISPPRRHS